MKCGNNVNILTFVTARVLKAFEFQVTVVTIVLILVTAFFCYKKDVRACYCFGGRTTDVERDDNGKVKKKSVKSQVWIGIRQL